MAENSHVEFSYLYCILFSLVPPKTVQSLHVARLLIGCILPVTLISLQK